MLKKIIIGITSATLLWQTAYAKLNVTIYFLPGFDSLKTTNVDTVSASQSKNKIVIGEVLKTNSSFQTVRSGPRGQQTSVFTRGTNSNSTLFMINGSPVTDHSTSNGLFDAGVDSVTYANSVDLYKGSQSTLWGPNAVGGAINVNTGIAYEDSIEVTAASNNTIGTGFTYSNILPTSSYSIKIHQQQSDGFSIVAGGDDDGYDYRTVNFDSEHLLSHGDLATTIVYRESDADLDGYGVDDTDYTADSRFYFIQARYSNPLFDFVIDRNVHDREYVNGSELDTYDSLTNHFKISHTNNFADVKYTVGTDVSMYSAQFENRGSYNSSVDKSADAIGYFINADYKVSDWIFNTGVRLDTNTLHDDVTTYRLGAGYEVNKNIMLIAGANTGFRAPTLYEMYGADNYGYTGNPNLEEERATTYEVGMVSQYKDEYSQLDSKFVIFSTEIDNMIEYTNSTYANTSGTSTMQGWELQNTQKYDDTKIKFSITSVHAQDSNNVQLTRRPQYSAVIGMEHDVTDKFSIWYDWNYYGKHRDIHPSTFATVDREEQHYTDVGFSYTLNGSTELLGTINNVTDLTYERPMGYSQAGREFSLTLKYFF